MVESKGCGIGRRSGAERCGLKLLLDAFSPIVAVLQLYSLFEHPWKVGCLDPDPLSG